MKNHGAEARARNRAPIAEDSKMPGEETIDQAPPSAESVAESDTDERETSEAEPSVPTGDADARVEELERALEEARAAEASARERWMRAVAELENFRRRTRKERADLLRTASEGVVRQLLDVMDALDGAVAAARDESGGNPLEALREGLGHIVSQMGRILRSEGVEVIEPAPGDRFDPAQEEALTAVPAPDAEPGTVLQVIQKGYRMGDRVLRPARVVVAAEVAPEAGETEGVNGAGEARSRDEAGPEDEADRAAGEG